MLDGYHSLGPFLRPSHAAEPHKVSTPGLPPPRARRTLAAAFTPLVDIYEGTHTIVLNLEAPGMKQEGFDIQVEDQTLAVRGACRFDAEKKEENDHRVERRYGSCYRAFTLPQTVDPEPGTGQLRGRYPTDRVRQAG